MLAGIKQKQANRVLEPLGVGDTESRAKRPRFSSAPPHIIADTRSTGADHAKVQSAAPPVEVEHSIARTPSASSLDPNAAEFVPSWGSSRQTPARPPLLVPPQPTLIQPTPHQPTPTQPADTNQPTPVHQPNSITCRCGNNFAALKCPDRLCSVCCTGCARHKRPKEKTTGPAPTATPTPTPTPAPTKPQLFGNDASREAVAREAAAKGAQRKAQVKAAVQVKTGAQVKVQWKAGGVQRKASERQQAGRKIAPRSPTYLLTYYLLAELPSC